MRLITAVSSGWRLECPPPVHIEAEFGTVSGGRVTRTMSPGQSCPVLPLDLRVSLVLEQGDFVGTKYDLAPLLNFISGENLIISAAVEPTESGIPETWIRTQLLSPGAALVTYSAYRIPAGARRWRLGWVGADWEASTVHPWQVEVSHFQGSAPIQRYSWVDVVSREWLEIPSWMAGNALLINRFPPAQTLAPTFDKLWSIDWEMGP